MHADACHFALVSNPQMFEFLTFEPFATPTSFIEWYENSVHADRGCVLFVAYDTPTASQQSPDASADELAAHGTFAGLIGLLRTSPEHLSTEIGFVLTLPAYQRTHVTTHGTGLLLNWCFDELHLRRVQWQTNTTNEKSWRAAEKIGFRKEGVIRWDRVLPAGYVGEDVRGRTGDPCPERMGRHTVRLAICWDEWEEGVKEVVRERMDQQK